MEDSNLRPLPYQRSALTNWANRPHLKAHYLLIGTSTFYVKTLRFTMSWARDTFAFSGKTVTPRPAKRHGRGAAIPSGARLAGESEGISKNNTKKHHHVSGGASTLNFE